MIAGGMIGYLAGWKPSQYSIVDVAGAWSIAIGILLLGLFMIAMGLYLRYHDRSIRIPTMILEVTYGNNDMHAKR